MKTTLKTVLGVGLVAFAQGGIAQQESWDPKPAIKRC